MNPRTIRQLETHGFAIAALDKKRYFVTTIDTPGVEVYYLVRVKFGVFAVDQDENSAPRLPRACQARGSEAHVSGQDDAPDGWTHAAMGSDCWRLSAVSRMSATASHVRFRTR